MRYQNFKGLFLVEVGKGLQDFLHEIIIALKWDFKGEAVYESDTFPDFFENMVIIMGNYTFGSESQIPEFDEERLDRLNIEYLHQVKFGERNSLLLHH